jgi:HEAT repeat protein
VAADDQVFCAARRCAASRAEAFQFGEGARGMRGPSAAGVVMATADTPADNPAWIERRGGGHGKRATRPPRGPARGVAVGLGRPTNTTRVKLLAAALAAAAPALLRPVAALGQAASTRPAQPLAPATAPATTAPASARGAAPITDPAVLLRAPNIPQADRDEAARRILVQQTPEARQLIAAALTDAGNRGAQVAAARAIALDPQPDQAFVNPLFELIGPHPAGPQPTLTDAAIQALANYRSQPDVAHNLIRLAMNAQKQQALSTQLSAIRAVGTMPTKQAAGVLIELLNAENEPASVRSAAAAALSDMTAAGVVRSDPAYWQAWWAENQNKPAEQFERDLLDARGARLVRVQNRFDRFVAETRLILEELYQRAPESQKESILLRYLRNPEPETRALGAKIVQDDFRATRPITPAVRDQLRGMVADRAAAVRIAVAQALLLLNDAQALDALLAQLAREPDADVRMELARALVPMRDARVVDPLVKLLRDRSLAVAEVAARGLASEDIAPLIRKDPQLANKVAAELQTALARTGAPGTASLRAAIVDAMGTLQSPNLRNVFTQMLRPKEPVPVRRAALRALAQFGKPNGQTWPAMDIGEVLVRDPDEAVRQEAVRALKNTADFAHANMLYDLMNAKDTSPSLRDEAWGVLRNLFTDRNATNSQLQAFADRFKNEPERRIEVLRVLAERLTSASDEKGQDNLASTRQNLGAEYMALARRNAARQDLEPLARDQLVIENAKQADMYFDLALKHYRAKDPTDQGMATSNLLELRMDALLTSKQYKQATEFAADSIAANPGNQEAMGRKIRGAVDRLRGAGQVADALALIDAAKTMNPPLQMRDTSSIARIEEEIRRSQNPTPPSNEPLKTPQSAVGSGQ